MGLGGAGRRHNLIRASGEATAHLPALGQRIEAAALDATLRYFGRSVDGRLDLDGDGLVDLAVGAQGAAVLLQ